MVRIQVCNINGTGVEGTGTWTVPTMDRYLPVRTASTVPIQSFSGDFFYQGSGRFLYMAVLKEKQTLQASPRPSFFQ